MTQSLRRIHWLARLARSCSQHPIVCILIWFVVIVGCLTSSFVWHGSTDDTYSVPGSSSARTQQLLNQKFSKSSGAEAVVVLYSRATITRARARTAIDDSIGELLRLSHQVARVVSPYRPSSRMISRSRTTGYVEVQYSATASALGWKSVEALERAFSPVRAVGIQTAFGGELVQATQPLATSASEGLGITAAGVLLVLIFGSLIAAALPLVIAVCAVGAGLSLIGVGERFVSVPSVGPSLAAMIGLGVGIDYSLLLITRYREHWEDDISQGERIALVVDSAGRAVTSAGFIVILALLALFVAGIPAVSAIGVSVAVVVALAVLSGITLLPAFLSLFPRQIARTWRARHGETRKASWYSWVVAVTRRPLISIACVVCVLGILSVPLFTMRLGQLDASAQPKSNTQWQAFELLTHAFGPGVNGPITIVVSASPKDERAATRIVMEKIQTMADVQAIGTPLTGGGGTDTLITVIPASAPSSATTTRLVSHLERLRILSGTGASGGVFVGGSTATFVDVSNRIGQRLVFVIAGIVVVALLFLARIFKAPVVALKAALMNLLSIGASYGVVVAVFQWGWGRGLIGVHRAVPIVSFIPLLMFVFLFGISMDYEVFILSRIQEGWFSSRDAKKSVLEGVATTGPIVTSAAAIMVVVFSSFVLASDPNVKMMGLGLAVAVLLDATLVRVVLLPATMVVLGSANWWRVKVPWTRHIVRGPEGWQDPESTKPSIPINSV